MTTEQRPIKQYDWPLLTNRDIRYIHVSIKKKYDALREQKETATPNEEYENFVNAHLEAAAEFIRTEQEETIESHGRH